MAGKSLTPGSGSGKVFGGFSDQVTVVGEPDASEDEVRLDGSSSRSRVGLGLGSGFSSGFQIMFRVVLSSGQLFQVVVLVQYCRKLRRTSGRESGKATNA